MEALRNDGCASGAERLVGGLLRKQLQEHAVLWSNQRVTDDRRNAEVDFFLALPDVGFVAVEVKGGQISYDGQHWTQTSQTGHHHRCDPVRQAREGMYGLHVRSAHIRGSRSPLGITRAGPLGACGGLALHGRARRLRRPAVPARHDRWSR